MIADVPLMKRIICGILLFVVVCVGIVAVWQRDNIGALIAGLRYSQEELEDKLAQNDQAIKDAVQMVPDVSIRDITEEDKQALKDGTITKEELIQNLVKPSQPPKQEGSGQTQQPPKQEKPGQAQQPPKQEEPAPVQPEQADPLQAEVSAIVAEVYVLREEFLIRLDKLMAQALADYKALAPEERTGSKLAGMVSDYMAKGLAMEKECDAQIEQIVARLEQVLIDGGGDFSIAETVFDTYVNEKSLKKAWYMAELKKRGLI